MAGGGGWWRVVVADDDAHTIHNSDFHNINGIVSMLSDRGLDAGGSAYLTVFGHPIVIVLT